MKSIDIKKISSGLMKRKGFVIFVLFLVLIFLLQMITILGSFINGQKIYKGVCVAGIHIGSKSKDEVRDIIQKEIIDKKDEKKIIVKINGEKFEIEYKDLNVVYMIDDIVDEAYEIGRTGGILKRFNDIAKCSSKNKNVCLNCSIDEDVLNYKIEAMYEQVSKESSGYNVKIENKKAVVKKGGQKVEFDKTGLFKAIKKKIDYCLEGTIDVKVTTISENEYNVDTLRDAIVRAPKNASIDENGKINEHRVGIDVMEMFLIESIDKIISGEEQVIPIYYINPEITTNDLKTKLFRNKLGSFTTKINLNNENRVNNIIISAKEIDGIIIPSKGLFKFNSIIGEQTEEKGYKLAPTYVDYEIKDALGGGVCQVASTIHNVAMRCSDIEIFDRRCHQRYVSYVEYGMDATVSYGNQDYVFKNNSKWPIRINVKIENDGLVVSIYGTKDSNKKVIIKNEMVSEIPYKIEYVSNVEDVVDNPIKGSFWKTYRRIEENGKEVITEIYESQYYPINKRILVEN